MTYLGKKKKKLPKRSLCVYVCVVPSLGDQNYPKYYIRRVASKW